MEQTPKPRPTTVITTPIQRHEVVLKDWITGREREYIDAPMLDAVKTKPQFNGKSIDLESIHIRQCMEQSENREIETFVVSVDGSTEKVIDSVKDMHEEDTAFVRQAIKDLTDSSKKKDLSVTGESA
jgi:hypothetical protein